MKADVNGPFVAPEWTELQIYCGQVAGSVGDLCLCVWGWRDPIAQDFAHATGEAMQLTNILRDLQEDVANGPLYLPKEALTEAEIHSRVPLEVLSHQNLIRACAHVADHAERKYRQARTLWHTVKHKEATPAWVMLCLYQALLRKVIKSNYRPNGPRIRLSVFGRAYHLTHAYLTA